MAYEIPPYPPAVDKTQRREATPVSLFEPIPAMERPIFFHYAHDFLSAV